MASILDGVDKRTQLVGENRLELLLFRLRGKQVYGINVFKVQEVIRCPDLTRMPNAVPIVRGIAKLRGKTIPVIDLGMALGDSAVDDLQSAFVIIADYNRTVQGFLVSGVERIINMNWQEILPPPKGSGKSTYMTAVTKVDGKLVEIIDVEKVLSEVTGSTLDVSEAVTAQRDEAQRPLRVLVADDSSVARKQIQRALEQVGITPVMTKDGKEALETLQKWVADGSMIADHIDMVISDVEMPNMDGYTLTTEIRKDNRLKDTFVMLHTSLSGVFNHAMVKKVGADRFVAKFNPDEFAGAVMEVVKKVGSASRTA